MNGIVTAGSSLFTVSLPFLLRVLIDSVGLYNTLRVLCILIFILFLAGFTYKPLVSNAKDKEGGKKGKFRFRPEKKICNFSVFKVLSYRIWALGIPAALFGYFVPYVHLVSARFFLHMMYLKLQLFPFVLWIKKTIGDRKQYLKCKLCGRNTKLILTLSVIKRGL